MIPQKIYPTIILFLSCVLLPSTALIGQTESEEDTFRLIRIAKSLEITENGDMPEDSFPTDIRYMSKDGEVKLRIGTRRPSRKQTLPNSKTLELYNWLPVPPGAPAGTMPVKNVLAKIPLNSSNKQFVIITQSKTASEFPLAGFSLTDMDQEHRAGQARIINLSSFNVAMAMEESRVTAKARTTDSLVDFTPGMTDIIVAIEVNDKGQWMRADGNKLRLVDTIKMYAIVYDHPPTEENPAPVRVSMFTERIRQAQNPQ